MPAGRACNEMSQVLSSLHSLTSPYTINLEMRGASKRKGKAEERARRKQPPRGRARRAASLRLPACILYHAKWAPVKSPGSVLAAKTEAAHLLRSHLPAALAIQKETELETSATALNGQRTERSSSEE